VCEQGEHGKQRIKKNKKNYDSGEGFDEAEGAEEAEEAEEAEADLCQDGPGHASRQRGVFHVPVWQFRLPQVQ
jgi:hypothetical protein